MRSPSLTLIAAAFGAVLLTGLGTPVRADDDADLSGVASDLAQAQRDCSLYHRWSDCLQLPGAVAPVPRREAAYRYGGTHAGGPADDLIPVGPLGAGAR